MALEALAPRQPHGRTAEFRRAPAPASAGSETSYQPAQNGTVSAQRGGGLRGRGDGVGQRDGVLGLGHLVDGRRARAPLCAARSRTPTTSIRLVVAWMAHALALYGDPLQTTWPDVTSL